MSESHIQKKVGEFAKAQGWRAYPFRSVNHNAIPDRIYFRKSQTKMIEFKDAGEEPTPLQAYEIRELRAEGMDVHVIDNVEDGKDVFRLQRDMLHDYQRRAVQFAKDHPKCALWMDMGLGKTATTLTVAVDLLEEFEFENALVIAPLRVAKSVWPSEVTKWAHTRKLVVNNLCVPASKRKKAYEKPADIHVINRELVTKLVEYWGQNWPYDFVIIDESSSFKSHQSKRFKSLKKVRNKIERMIQLTGTPASNGLHDLWSQIFLLDGGERLGKTITAYRRAYFDQDYHGFTWTPKDGVKDKIYQKLDDIVLTLSSEDYLSLPPYILNRVELDMPADTAKQYKTLEKDFILELEDADVTALHAASLTNKLLQFANGAIYSGDADERITVNVHSLKLDALSDIIDEAAGSPVLVAYNYKSDAERIQNRFKQAVLLDADNATIEKWNAGKIPLLLAHPASAGHGLNLQDGGNTLVWYGLNWSLELYQQFNKRLHRQGQTKPVIAHHIIIKDSVDETVMAALEAKNTTQKALLDALKKDVKRRTTP
ncbi:SNF2-related protein [Litorimonas haliclonae]|uniref:SNF2-related protein n=1 Tax=Litorimonas haliclonae TaxID=2081977 RepID=UPI0039EE06C5